MQAQAAEESKRAAVMRAKRASWAGESVPVRISGRASTVIRRYGAANNLPFAEALDELLKASAFFKSTGGKWEDVTPYKSRRRDKQDAPQAAQAAKATNKKTSSKSSSKPSKSSSTKKG